MRTPAQLGRLATLAHETIDRPGVHELALALAVTGDLGVPLGDVDRLHPQRLRQRRPTFARCRHGGFPASVAGDVQHRLLDEMGNQTRIGAVGYHRGRPASHRPAGRQRAFPQRIVGTLRRRQGRVGIATFPGLDAGIEIQRALRLAQFRQGNGGNIDRQVEQEISVTQQRPQNLPVIFPRQGPHDMRNAEFGSDLGTTGIAGHDLDLVLRHVDMPQDQRQNPLADAAETEHDQPARERDMFRHETSFCVKPTASRWSRMP